jgi:hypothetical protein
MADFLIHGDLKISKDGKFEAIVWLKQKGKAGSTMDVIKASSPDIGFDLLRNFYSRQIEKARETAG